MTFLNSCHETSSRNPGTRGAASYEFPKTPSFHLCWSGINGLVLFHDRRLGRRHEGPVCFDVTDRFQSTNAHCY